MRFGKLELTPAENPGVLDAATWDAKAAWMALSNARFDWPAANRAGLSGTPLPAGEGVDTHNGSMSRAADGVYFLASLPDGQDVFVRIGSNGPSPLGEPFGR